MPGDGEPGSAAELRLRELTDQALLLLDQLAEARNRAAHADNERRQWHARCNDLLARVADLEARVRRAGAVRLGPWRPSADAAPPCEVFLWFDGSLDDLRRDQWLADLRGWLKDHAATLVVPTGAVPPERVLRLLPTLAVQEVEGDRPAHLWNAVVAACSSPMALLVGPGAEPHPELKPQAFGAFDDDAIALVQPLLRRGARNRPSLGLTLDAALQAHPNWLSGRDDGDELIEVDAAAPELFAIRKRSLVAVGPFDQDLSGDLALVEFGLRARAKGMRLVAAPRQSGRSKCRRPERDDERDRLLLVARHRPQQVAAALAASDLLQRSSAAGGAELLRAVLRHLPEAGEWPRGIEVLAAALDAIMRQLPAAGERVVDELAEALQCARASAAGDDDDDAPAPRPGGGTSLQAAIARARELVAANEELDRRLHQVQTENAELHEALRVCNAAREGSEAARARTRAELDELRADTHRTLEQLRVAAETDRELRARLAGALGQQETESGALLAAVNQLRQDMHVRSAWLARLIEEKRRRRLKLFPRLTTDEQRFLAEFGGAE